MKSKELQNLKKFASATTQIKIVVISNITFEPYFKLLLAKAFSDKQISVLVSFVDYSEFLVGDFTDEIIDSCIIAVIPNFDCMYSDIGINADISNVVPDEIVNEASSRAEQICSLIRDNSSASILWFSYEDYCYKYSNVIGNVPVAQMTVDRLNQNLYFLISDKALFIDTKRLIAEIGISNAYNDKYKYRWNAPYSRSMIERICDEIYSQYLVVHGLTKKCIVLDCDNVLWGGVISEDGIENIYLGNVGLGRQHKEFQRFLLYLYNHGVILTVCSKNDKDDVIKVFREHSEMILREEHIACFQVNWDKKTDNIRKIANTLNVSLDSIVFVDDSDFEIQAVEQLIPEVTAIKYSYKTIYDNLCCFNLKHVVDIEEITKRNNTYKSNEQRQELKKVSITFDDYLKSLEMEIDIHPAIPVEYARIAELTQRTNKCTNGNRYTIEEIVARTQCSNVCLYAVYIKDKFSDLGLVGAMEIEDTTVTLFSLSCRALGRDIEKKMIEHLEYYHLIDKVKFIPTGKNERLRTIMPNYN